MSRQETRGAPVADSLRGLYPEHEKLHAVHEKSQAIGDFLAWAAEEHGLRLCKQGGVPDYADSLWWPDTRPMTRRLAEFFDIDEGKLEAEKREILDGLRAGGSP